MKLCHETMRTATKLTEKKNYKTVQNVKEGILNNTPNTKEAQMEKLEEDMKIVIVLQF